MAEGRSAGAGALGDDGGGYSATERAGRAGRCAGQPVAPATGAGSADRARIGIGCHEGHRGGRRRRDHSPSVRPGGAARSTSVSRSAAVWPMEVSFGPIRAQAGAVTCRGVRKNRRGAERWRGATAGSSCARADPLLPRGVHVPRMPGWNCAFLFLIRRIARSAGDCPMTPTQRCSRISA